MELAIIGGGAIALTCGLYISEKSPEYNITIFLGESDHKGASKAAGAMLNVLSEVDILNYSSDLTDFKLRNYQDLFFEWNYVENLLMKESNKKLISGIGTEIRLKNINSNLIETESFNSMINSARKYNIEIDKINSNTSFLIPREKSVDSELYLGMLYKALLKRGVNLKHKNVNSLKNNENDKVKVNTLDSQESFDKVLIAAGAFTDEIIRNSNFTNKNLIQSFYGVGSALLISAELPYIKAPIFDRIIRTPNRGGTCGIHCVQREDQVYVGASSMASINKVKLARAESIETLIRGTKDLIGIDLTGLSLSLTLGYRPTTIDTCPAIGPLDKNCFAIYGTKRDGFTWAPFFAMNYVKLLKGELTANFSHLIDKYNPFRKPISFGSQEYSSEKYISSKIAENLQHNKILSHSEIESLRKNINELHKKLPKTFGVHPELANILIHNKYQLNSLMKSLN